MKFTLTIAILFASILAPQVSQATPPTQKCLHDLKWNRWSYTKAHFNVTNTLSNKYHRISMDWSHVRSNKQCVSALSKAKALRLAEYKRWEKLRLSPAGVKFIIRRQFWRMGQRVVSNALHVASCESNFRYNSYNGADSGVWQINWVHYVPKHVMFSPELSTAWAWRASDHGRNWSPTWVCATLRGIA